MDHHYAFYTSTPLVAGLKRLLEQLEQRLGLQEPLQLYLAGGMAVHLYTSGRMTTDVDAEFSRKLLIPNDLAVEVTLEDKSKQLLYLDTSYNPTFALMHGDYVEDSLPVDLGLKHIEVRVLSPVDLAVSKVARLADNDREDISSLIKLGLTNSQAIEARALEAIGGYVDGMSMLRANLTDVLHLARCAESERR